MGCATAPWHSRRRRRRALGAATADRPAGVSEVQPTRSNFQQCAFMRKGVGHDVDRHNHDPVLADSAQEAFSPADRENLILAWSTDLRRRRTVISPYRHRTFATAIIGRAGDVRTAARRSQTRCRATPGRRDGTVLTHYGGDQAAWQFALAWPARSGNRRAGCVATGGVFSRSSAHREPRGQSDRPRPSR